MIYQQQIVLRPILSLIAIEKFLKKNHGSWNEVVLGR